MATIRPKFVVGIGGSAGGLAAYKALLAALPSDTNMAFVIVSHIFPSANSLLAGILSRHTKMPVMVVATGMPIRANHVYVLPANVDLFVEGEAFKVVSPRSRANVQIDLFFISLAEAMGARAIGVILSGFDGDGTAGCEHIKAKGGKTFAQDRSAEVAEMPDSVQAAGYIDFVDIAGGFRFAEKIGTQYHALDTGQRLDRRHPFRRNFGPIGNRWLRYAQLAREFTDAANGTDRFIEPRVPHPAHFQIVTM